MSVQVKQGWCRHCESVQRGDVEFRCESCGEPLKPLSGMTRAEKAAAEFMEWSARVQEEGKWGPSPGGAAGELKCSRGMVDKLVAAGLLERSEYRGEGHFVVMISQRSIEQVKRQKSRTGQWKPRKSGEGA